MAPSFEVDPFWPKPLPNHWVLGSTIGVSVDSRDHVWIVHRPGSVDENFKGADLKPKVGTCCVVGAPSPRARSGRQRRRVVGRTGPGLRLAGQQSRHHGRPQGQRLARRQRRQGHADPEVHAGRQVPAPDRQARRAQRQQRHREPLAADEDLRGRPTANEVYVADGYGNRRVIVFDADTGKYKRHWGAYGTSRTTIRCPPTIPPRRRRSSSTSCTARSSRRTGSSTSATASERSRSGVPQGRHVREGSVLRQGHAALRLGVGHDVLARPRSRSTSTWRTA